jgi:hypothetical protein
VSWVEEELSLFRGLSVTIDVIKDVSLALKKLETEKYDLIVKGLEFSFSGFKTKSIIDKVKEIGIKTVFYVDSHYYDHVVFAAKAHGFVTEDQWCKIFTFLKKIKSKDYQFEPGLHKFETLFIGDKIYGVSFVDLIQDALIKKQSEPLFIKYTKYGQASYYFSKDSFYTDRYKKY